MDGGGAVYGGEELASVEGWEEGSDSVDGEREGAAKDGEECWGKGRRRVHCQRQG